MRVKKGGRMAVRCKMVCNTKQQFGENSNLVFSPVYSGSDENKSFFAATPGGSFQFYTVNKASADQFEMGKEYYFDITAA
jgi:hypothetical protein